MRKRHAFSMGQHLGLTIAHFLGQLSINVPGTGAVVAAVSLRPLALFLPVTLGENPIILGTEIKFTTPPKLMLLPRGILFDVGDTLLFQEKIDAPAGFDRVREVASNGKAIQAVAFREAGERLLHDVISWRSEIRRSALNHLELRFQSYLRLLLEGFGLETSLDLSDLEREFWKVACPMLPEPGVHAVLDHLEARGIRIGVVSNTIFGSPTVEWELGRHSLTEHLAFVMGSADYGVRKPHPALFLTAAKKLGLKPGEVWFVGNTWDTDITGATRAGLVPVWYTRRIADVGDYSGTQVKDWDAFLTLLKELE